VSRRLITDDTSLVACVLAACPDATLRVTCDAVSLRCSFVFEFDADDAPTCIENVTAQYQNGSLQVNARDLLREQRELRDTVREAKKAAQADESPEALQARAIAFRRAHPNESTNPYVYRLLALSRAAGERTEAAERFAAVARAQAANAPAMPEPRDAGNPWRPRATTRPVEPEENGDDADAPEAAEA